MRGHNCIFVYLFLFPNFFNPDASNGVTNRGKRRLRLNSRGKNAK
jgi:hypothetical protein